MKKIITVLFLLCGVVFGQVSIPATNWVEISFNATLSGVNSGAFSGAGFAATPSSGQLNSNAWATTGISDGSSSFGDTKTSGDFSRGNSSGGVGTGGFYSFDVAVGGGNNTLGIQPGGSDWTPGAITLKAINNSGVTTSKINISYDIWTYNDQERANSMNFSYSLDNSSYTDIPALNYTTPEASDVSPGWIKVSRTTSITVALSDGSPIYFKWSGDDVSGSGSRDEYSIDNIRISINDQPLPVELTTFTASMVDQNVELNWETATEVNNYGFEVERASTSSATETSWSKVGFVEGHGNSNSPKIYSFIDKSISVSGKYNYRLKQIDIDGSFEYSDVVEVNLATPEKFELNQNYPNPFNPTTSIQFNLPQDGNVKLSVFNVLGEEVAELLNGNIEAGYHNVSFNASALNSGIYFYKIETGNIIKIRKMMLLK